VWRHVDTTAFDGLLGDGVGICFSFDEISKATFNWAKMTVSVISSDKKISTLALTDYAQFYSGIEGFVCQADVQCPYRQYRLEMGK
jgi:hypothetical protein